MGLHAKMTALADAIREKSGISEPLGLDSMCQTVQGLHTFVPSVSGTADPDEVYRTTRPADWLPMPTPNDNEVYCLCLIPESVDSVFTARLVFSGECSVEFGNLVNGVFTAKERIAPTTNVRFYHTVNADHYGNITSDGYKQYLVRITGVITKAEMLIDSYDAYEYGSHQLVDIAVGLKTDLQCGTQMGAQGCPYLKYVRFMGNGQLYNSIGQNFRNCYSLVSVSSEQRATASFASYMFTNCRSLLAVSPEVFVSNIGYNSAFNGARLISLNSAQVFPTKVSNVFRDTFGCNQIDGSKFNTMNCEDFSDFAYGSKITEIENLDISSMKQTNRMFGNCYLVKLTFAGETTPGGWTIDVTKGLMRHQALVDMINSLPTATEAATITITGNPGANQLTDAEIAVATSRNWTITI